MLGGGLEGISISIKKLQISFMLVHLSFELLFISIQCDAGDLIITELLIHIGENKTEVKQEVIREILRDRLYTSIAGREDLWGVQIDKVCSKFGHCGVKNIMISKEKASML